ncbi:hypothetical protein RhiJN_15052 [Ceratobasidium sp. AG-Ba]|nr:hypothetical protein RhiJN_15052 [Ceratobasidium sp. AG-Ba]
MGKAFFNNAEVAFLQEYLDEWMSLKRGNDGLSATERIKSRNRLVRRVIEEFYEAFPKRDSTQNDPTEETYSQEEREGLYARLKEWFNNCTREKGGRERRAIKKIKKTITARILISKHYTKDISPIAQRIRSEDPSLSRIAARNKATTQFIEEMKVEDPDEYERFQVLAWDVRQAAQTDYAEKSEEALRE